MSLLASRVLATTRRNFTTSSIRRDLAKVTLIGHLGKQPELRVGKSGNEYVMFSISTRTGSKLTPDGAREDNPPLWHTVFSFNPAAAQYLTSLPKGSMVYVEGSLGYKDLESGVGRQAVIRHESLRVLRRGASADASETEPAEDKID